MVSNLQFAAVAAYLLWCLFSALTGMVGSDEQAAAPEIDESDKNAHCRLARGRTMGSRGPERSPMTELKSPTAVLHEGPRSLSEDETAEIERRDLQEMRQVDIDDVIEYVHHGLRKLPDFVTLYRKYLKQRWDVYELDFTQDRIDWTEKMTEDERESFMGIASGFHHGERQVEIELPVFMMGATRGGEASHRRPDRGRGAAHRLLRPVLPRGRRHRGQRHHGGARQDLPVGAGDVRRPVRVCSPTRPTSCAGTRMTNAPVSGTGRRTSCGSRACSRCRS